MSDQLRFDPVLPAHAIERCAATIIFAQPLPAPAVRAAIEIVSSRAANWQRLRQADGRSGVAITFDTKTGKVSLGAPEGIFHYELPSNASNLAVMQNLVAWQTGNYVRWKPFLGDLKAFAMPVVEALLEHAPINAVKLEYWDRFVWSGSLSEMDPALLLRPGLGLVAPSVVKKGLPWHSHSGWFEPKGDGCRRLTNVNLDVVDAVVRAGREPRPTIGILTMLQDEFSPESQRQLRESKQVEDKLEELHVALKTLLGLIISDSMTQRISLQSLEI